MAGPGDEIAAGSGGQGRLRASHADREQVIEMLKAAFVQGRLERDELDLRAGRALASRTCAELAALTAGTPDGLTGAGLPEPARKSVNKKALAAVACATAAFVGMLSVFRMTPDGSPFLPLMVVVTVVLLAAVPAGWLLLFHDWLDKRAGRKSAQGLPPAGRDGTSRHPASAGPARQLPPTGHDLRHTAEAAQSRLPRLPLPGLRATASRASRAPVRDWLPQPPTGGRPRIRAANCQLTPVLPKLC